MLGTEIGQVTDLVIVAEARVQGDRGQAKLDSIDKGAFHACGDDPAHIPKLTHIIVEVGIKDRFYDVDIGSSIVTSEKIIDELQVRAMTTWFPSSS